MNEKGRVIVRIHLCNTCVYSDTAFDPWGLILNEINKANGFQNRFEYQNKEKESTFNLRRIDFGARSYNASIGRFDRVDPLAEKRDRLTPNNFVKNNPLNRIDPNGTLDEPCCGDGADGIGNGMTLVENIYWSTRDALASSVLTVSTFVGSLFSDTKTQRLNASYENGKRILSTEVVPKEQLASEMTGSVFTLATAVPSGGSNAGTGMLLAKTGTKTSTASSVVKTIKEQAEEIKTTLNKGKNSVTLKTAQGQTRYDLSGKAHAGVDTPHSQKYKNNVVGGVVRSVTRESKNASPMTQEEIRAIRKFLEKLI